MGTVILQEGETKGFRATPRGGAGEIETVDGPISIESSDPAAAVVTVIDAAAGTFSVKGGPHLDTAPAVRPWTITASTDADRGAGVRKIIGTLQGETHAPEAITLEIVEDPSVLTPPAPAPAAAPPQP